MHLVASVCLSVCALTAEPFDLEPYYQSKVFVCVSVIRGRIRIIARIHAVDRRFTYLNLLK